MLEFLKEIGVSSTDTNERRLRKYNLVIIALSCCIISPLWYEVSLINAVIPHAAFYHRHYFPPGFQTGKIPLQYNSDHRLSLSSYYAVAHWWIA